MKKIVFLIFAFSAFLAGCKFQIQEGFYRNNNVRQRSDKIFELNTREEGSFIPLDGSGKYSVFLITR